jgi:hypothetical protein
MFNDDLLKSNGRTWKEVVVACYEVLPQNVEGGNGNHEPHELGWPVCGPEFETLDSDVKRKVVPVLQLSTIP